MRVSGLQNIPANILRQNMTYNICANEITLRKKTSKYRKYENSPELLNK